eukprot:1702332-Prymnesium_polylepis.2
MLSPYLLDSDSTLSLPVSGCYLCSLDNTFHVSSSLALESVRSPSPSTELGSCGASTPAPPNLGPNAPSHPGSLPAEPRTRQRSGTLRTPRLRVAAKRARKLEGLVLVAANLYRRRRVADLDRPAGRGNAARGRARPSARRRARARTLARTSCARRWGGGLWRGVAAKRVARTSSRRLV